MITTFEILKKLGIDPVHEIVKVIYSMVIGGKTDIYEKASNICAYLGVSDTRKDEIIELLNKI